MAASMVEIAVATAQRVNVAHAVRHASPLLLDALAMRGVALGDVLDRLEAPPALYRGGRGGRCPACAYRLRKGRTSANAPWTADEFSAPLTLVPGEGLHMVWSGSRLGLRGSAGRLGVATADATAWLGIEDELPATIALALVGRPVDALVSHPLLDGRDYVVLRVVPYDRGVGGTMIEVRTGLRRCRAPRAPRHTLDAGLAEMMSIAEAAR